MCWIVIWWNGSVAGSTPRYSNIANKLEKCKRQQIIIHVFYRRVRTQPYNETLDLSASLIFSSKNKNTENQIIVTHFARVVH